jgi:enoyl-CoA hydratase/carnithine racemase
MRERYGDITLTVHDHVALAVIDRPPHNHATVELLRDLADALNDVDADKQLRCTVLATAGKSFCAGADFSTDIGDSIFREDGTSLFYDQAVRLFSTRKPIVVAVQGAAIGAGLGLSLIADFRIAAPEARFSANFVKLAFHPGFGITYVLPRLIGQQRASLMCLTGRRVKPDEALAYGLVDQVVPAEQLREAAMKLAAEIAENGPLAVEMTRATLRDDLAAKVKAQTVKESMAQAALRKTKDFAEGVLAVRERRPGNFRGE